MKTVFNNSMVAHVWAQQNQEHGRSNNGQFYFDGRTIYSYRDSWPLGHFHKSGFILLNTQSYSKTTSAHLGDVRQALGWGREGVIHIPSTRIMILAVDSSSREIDAPYAANSICGEVKILVEACVKSAAKRKKPSLQDQDIGEALSHISMAEKLCEILGCSVQFHQQLSILRTSLMEDRETLMSAKAEEIKAERDAQASLKKERKERRAAALKEALELWRDAKALTWEQSSALRDSGEIYMRVRGYTIETSRGADFPVDHGIKAFKFIREIKEGAASGWKRNGKSIHLGHFQIDEIEAGGNVKAGCHYVAWPEIESIARQLEIYP